MDDVGLVQSVLDLTGFDILDCLCDIHGNCAGLGVGHQTLRTKDTAETTDNAHHIGCSDYYVEIQPAFILDSGKELLAADEISACFLCLIQLRALCEYQDSDLLADTCGQNYRAADLLVSVTAVAACTNVDLNSLIKLRSCSFLCKCDCLFGLI